MKLRKKALLPAIAMVLASVIALSGVTYAWFTTGTTASVSNLDVNVQTANGIQVSLDAKSWKSEIKGSDIVAAITGATAYSTRIIQVPEGEVAPVSSAANVDANGKVEMFFGEYDKDGNLRSAKETEANGVGGNFVAFDLFFKSSGAQPLSLSMTNSAVTCVDVNEKDENGRPVASDEGTEKAVRVAFVPYGTKGTAEEARALTSYTGKALVWEPNAFNHVSDDVSTGVKAYNGFTAEFESVPEESLGEGQVEPVSTHTDTANDMNVLDLEAGISKVRVYVWLEGQDVDCINEISFGDFSVKMTFAVPEVQD